MDTYLINISLTGYKNMSIEDTSTINNSNIVIVVDTISEDAIEHYKNLRELLITTNRIFLVTVGDLDNSIGKSLRALMCSYREYDIYNVVSRDTIDSSYIETILKRKPDYLEASTFIGGDASAYAEICTILIGIDSLVAEGNVEGLSVFLEQHINSIENITYVIDSMKTIVDTYNSKELVYTIEELSNQLKQYKDRVESADSSITKLEEDKKSLVANLEECKNKLKAEVNKVELFTESKQTDQFVIKEYKEVNTSIIKCKTQRVIYFKEISSIPYINSMILALVARIKIQCRVKLLIYDSNNSLSQYNPLIGIDTKEYMNKKEIYSGNKEVMLIVEPNQAILRDVLEYSKEANDVVIIYDRMKKKENLVSGNNVHKFYVLNSLHDFKQAKTIFNISDMSSIITRSTHISKDVLDIPTIDQYQDGTPASKKSKYFRLVTSISKQVLIDNILQKVRFKDIIKK